MDPNFWKARWTEGRIGFHEGEPNHFLVEHEAELGAKQGVFVPLCGKAEDMAWLAARGSRVVGVELAEAAVRAFFDEHGLVPEMTREADFLRLSHGNIALLVGDFFHTSPSDVGAVDTFYDRAALVALPEPVRARYVAHLRSLFPAGARGLVVTFEYPEDQMQGPPFSVRESEVLALYAGAKVELLGESAAELARLRAMGAAAVERCYLVSW